MKCSSTTKRLSAFLVSTSLIGVALRAQSLPTSPAAPLTLAQAISLAQLNYPRVRAAAEQQAAAQGGVGIAKAAYLPRADILWQANRATANNVYGLLLPQSVIPPISGPVLPADIGRSAWGTAAGGLIGWQPFDFGARAAEVTAAREGVAAATAALNVAKLDIGLAAANAYFDLATAQQLAAVSQANVNRLEAFAKSVHALVDNQLRPGADASQADAALATARTQLIQAHTAVTVRRAALANLLGLVVDAVQLDAATLMQSLPQETQLSTDVLSHPSVLQESASVRQQQARLSAISHSYVPQFSTEVAVSGRGMGTALTGNFPGGTKGLVPDTMNWAAGVQVTFPAFSFFSLRAQKKVQEANVRAEQARYGQVVTDANMQLLQAQAVLAGSRDVVQNTPAEITAAQQSEMQQRARFQAGLGTVVDVAAAESLLAQAEADDGIARLNVWRAYVAVAAARGDATLALSPATHP